jgi:hypothetical protein
LNRWGTTHADVFYITSEASNDFIPITAATIEFSPLALRKLFSAINSMLSASYEPNNNFGAVILFLGLDYIFDNNPSRSINSMLKKLFRYVKAYRGVLLISGALLREHEKQDLIAHGTIAIKGLDIKSALLKIIRVHFGTYAQWAVEAAIKNLQDSGSIPLGSTDIEFGDLPKLAVELTRIFRDCSSALSDNERHFWERKNKLVIDAVLQFYETAIVSSNLYNAGGS